MALRLRETFLIPCAVVFFLAFLARALPHLAVFPPSPALQILLIIGTVQFIQMRLISRRGAMEILIDRRGSQGRSPAHPDIVLKTQWLGIHARAAPVYSRAKDLSA